MNVEDIFKHFKVDLPEGQSGLWRVEKFEVDAQAAKAERLRAAFNGRGRAVPQGHYTKLMRDRVVVMSDTFAEIDDHMEPFYQCRRREDAHVLINGLGLGMFAAAIAQLDNVAAVEVVELNQDVIDLVAPTLTERYSNLTVHHGDAYTWKPPRGARYDVVWHDVWDYICEDNLPEMTYLHRRYGRRSGWQGSWAKELCRR